MSPTRQQRRAKARNPLTRSKRRGRYGFLAFLLIVLLGGTYLITLSRSNPAPLTRGAIAGEHWHASYRIYVCGNRMEAYPTVEGEIHSHGDGFMHIHPATPQYTGPNANLGNFLLLYETSVGVRDGRRFIAFPDGTVLRDGSKCPDGKRYKLVVLNKGKSVRGDPSKFVMHDGDQIVIRFGPTGRKVFRNPYSKVKNIQTPVQERPAPVPGG